MTISRVFRIHEAIGVNMLTNCRRDLAITAISCVDAEASKIPPCKLEDNVWMRVRVQSKDSNVRCQTRHLNTTNIIRGIMFDTEVDNAFELTSTCGASFISLNIQTPIASSILRTEVAPGICSVYHLCTLPSRAAQIQSYPSFRGTSKTASCSCCFEMTREPESLLGGHEQIRYSRRQCYQ